MILPLSLLKAAQNTALLIELKSGESYNGHMVSVDTFMNLHLRDTICTSKDGDRFHRIPEVYIRGSTIKVFRISTEALTQLKEDTKNLRQNQKQNKQYKKQLNRGAASGGGGARKKPATDDAGASEVPDKAPRNGTGGGGKRW